MVEVTMSMEEYLSLLNGLSMDSMPEPPADNQVMPKKKKTTRYQREYKKNFRKIAPKFKLKNGNWKKNGFRSAVKEAHKSTRKGQVRKTARRAFEKK